MQLTSFISWNSLQGVKQLPSQFPRDESKGFPSEVELQRIIRDYNNTHSFRPSPHTKTTALINKEIGARIVNVLQKKPSADLETVEFREWAQKGFQHISSGNLDGLLYEGKVGQRLVAFEEDFYDILVHFHEVSHRGRDKTNKALQDVYDWVPKLSILGRFIIELCPTCKTSRQPKEKRSSNKEKHFNPRPRNTIAPNFSNIDPLPSAVENNLCPPVDNDSHFQIPSACSGLPIDLVAPIVQNNSLKAFSFPGFTFGNQTFGDFSDISNLIPPPNDPNTSLSSEVPSFGPARRPLKSKAAKNASHPYQTTPPVASPVHLDEASLLDRFALGFYLYVNNPDFRQEVILLYAIWGVVDFSNPPDVHDTILVVFGAPSYLNDPNFRKELDQLYTKWGIFPLELPPMQNGIFPSQSASINPEQFSSTSLAPAHSTDIPVDNSMAYSTLTPAAPQFPAFNLDQSLLTSLLPSQTTNTLIDSWMAESSSTLVPSQPPADQSLCSTFVSEGNTDIPVDNGIGYWPDDLGSFMPTFDSTTFQSEFC